MQRILCRLNLVTKRGENVDKNASNIWLAFKYVHIEYRPDPSNTHSYRSTETPKKSSKLKRPIHVPTQVH